MVVFNSYVKLPEGNQRVQTTTQLAILGKRLEFGVIPTHHQNFEHPVIC